LGITLICLLTGTKSADVGNLIDANYGIHFRHLVPPLQQGWMNWLERMVAPRIQDRYQSAADALAALESLDVSSLPKVRIERDLLKFTATEYGEILTSAIAISNPIPDTILSGRWEVAPHPNDPPHTPYDHSWIFCEPQAFENNNIKCQIRVDTQKLLASKTYKRQIILRANSEPEIHTIELQVTTAPLPLPQKNIFLSVCWLTFMCCLILATFLCYSSLSGLILYLKDHGNFNDPEPSSFLNSWITTIMLTICITSGLLGFLVAEIAITSNLKKYDFNWLGALYGGLIGLIFSGFISILISIAFDIPKGMSDYQLIFFVCAGSVLVSISVTLLGALILGSIMNSTTVAVIMLLLLFSLYVYMGVIGLMVSVIVVLILALASLIYKSVNSTFNNLIDELISRQILEVDATKITFLTAGFCISLGVAFQLFLKLVTQLKSVEPMELIAVGGTTMAFLAVTAIPLINMIFFKPKRILADYRKSQPNLIKP